MRKLIIPKFKPTPILLSKQINELNDIKDSKHYIELKQIHKHQQNVYLYYEKFAEMNPSFGFEISLSFPSINLIENKQLNGIAYTYTNNDIFQNLSKIVYDSLCDYKQFLDILLYNPQPFIFLPKNSLFDIQNVMKNVKYENKMIKFSCDDKIIYLMDPLILRNLDLQFFITEYLKNDCISSIYVGFVYKKQIIEEEHL
ncbi:hypothetical protein SLOPH_1029 [Spraguea lophii 42_110]|uniref:Uncharacterized protein n=1 Tax=Spraguea lophii (strain 42_110) TaxID=1358809 RepID=S7XI90_SPRLO|nr:hypothetical protein SLOPH_1029 [Spraguea lophii 42_110]